MPNATFPVQSNNAIGSGVPTTGWTSSDPQSHTNRSQQSSICEFRRRDRFHFRRSHREHRSSRRRHAGHRLDRGSTTTGLPASKLDDERVGAATAGAWKHLGTIDSNRTRVDLSFVHQPVPTYPSSTNPAPAYPAPLTLRRVFRRPLTRARLPGDDLSQHEHAERCVALSLEFQCRDRQSVDPTPSVEQRHSHESTCGSICRCSISRTLHRTDQFGRRQQPESDVARARALSSSRSNGVVSLKKIWPAAGGAGRLRLLFLATDRIFRIHRLSK